MDTVVLPANRIVRATQVMAMRYRVASIVMGVLAAVLLVVGVWSQYAKPGSDVGVGVFAVASSDSLIMFFLLVVVPMGFAFLIRRRAKRLTWIGAQASGDPTLVWAVDDYRVIAVDEFGTPRPELGFKVTPLLRTELTGVAQAALR